MVHQKQVKKPHALLFDISGTVIKDKFIDRVLMPYIRVNVNEYLEKNWDSDLVRKDVASLRAASEEQVDAPKIGPGLDRDAEIEALARYVTYCMDHKVDNKAITMLRFHMWFDGFARELIETPVYSDVAIQLQKWRYEDGVKLYVFSNGWSAATKCFLGRTNHGNLNLLIEDHFDTSMGKLTDPDTYKKVTEAIKESAGDVLFLTKSGEEGLAASRAGLNVVLVLTHRQNIEKLDGEEKQLPRVRSFNEIDLV